MQRSRAEKLDPKINVLVILRVLSTQRNLLVFNLIADKEIVVGETFRRKLNMSRSNLSKSLSELVKVDLVRKKAGWYCLTSFGKIMHYLETETEKMVSLHQRFRVVDSINDFSNDQRNEIISRIILDPRAKEILLKNNLAPSFNTHGGFNNREVVNGDYDPSCRNVVIIDDEPDLIFTFQSILQGEGHTVHAFTDPYKALDTALDLYASKIKIDLLIVDIRMPGLNGLQVYKSFKALDENIRTLFVSALSDADELLKIYPGEDNVDLLKKPIDGDRLLKEVRRLLLLNPS
jgi:CheY-like chemotaxis protein/DNA-binding HxlR family transcriptional regulator